MSKITLSTVGSLTQNPTTAQTTINSNFSTIQTAMDNTLSRDGTLPNTMTSSLDMNSNQILNLPNPATANSPLRLTDLNSFVGGGTISNIPTGGTTNQVLAKHSNTNYDIAWVSVGGGTVTSVGLSLPADLTVTGSPVTASGTLTATWTNTPTGTGSIVRATSPTIASPTITGTIAGTNTAPLATLVTIPSGTVLGNISGSTGNVVATATPILGLAGSTVGTLGFNNLTSGAITVSPPTGALGTVTNTLQAAADTFVYRATTDTLTNKTMSGASNTFSSIALSSLATQSAYTLVGNATNSSASPTAFTVDSLTLKASPATSDEVLIWDVAGAAMKKATVSSVGSAGTVASINGQTGTIINHYFPQGRITLTSVTPVLTSTVSGATTVYYTPYQGDMCPLFDGTNMVPTQFSEVSQATTDTTKSPAAVAANSVYDLFVWSDSGTIRCTRGPAWTNTTTRGYTFTLQNGVYLNTSAVTNGPGALRGTWVGTIFSNGSSTVDFIFGAAASGGTAASFGLWNAYNRVLMSTAVIDNGTSYTYQSAAIRQARASAGMQVSFVLGAQEDGVYTSYSSRSDHTATANSQSRWGIGLDTTTAFTNQIESMIFNVTSAANVGVFTSSGIVSPTVGKHIISANERTDASNANTFNSDNSNTLMAMIRL